MGTKNLTKVPGRLVMTFGDSLLYDSGDYADEVSGMTLRIRGNTSAVAFDKKPYKINLQQKADLLMRGNKEKYQDKSWLLLKDERSTIWKLISFKVNEILGLQWTPAHRYVNLVINGKYQGMYELFESIKRNPSCRLNVDKTGFIFEYDLYFWNEDLYVKASESIKDIWPMNYTFKYPDTVDFTESQLTYFKKMIAQAEKSLSDGSYPEYIDVESFAEWILAHDLLGNHDGKGSNIFLTKKDTTENSKIMMGCLWDMDRIFEMEGNWDPSHGMFFFKLLFNNENKTFVNVYKQKWEQYSQAITEGLVSFLDYFVASETAHAIDQSTVLDNQRWGTNYGTVQQYVDQAREWFTQRKEWLDHEIGKLDTGTGIRVVRTAHTAAPYYNLQGQQVDHPKSGRIYIHQGHKVVLP